MFWKSQVNQVVKLLSHLHSVSPFMMLENNRYDIEFHLYYANIHNSKDLHAFWEQDASHVMEEGQVAHFTLPKDWIILACEILVHDFHVFVYQADKDENELVNTNILLRAIKKLRQHALCFVAQLADSSILEALDFANS